MKPRHALPLVLAAALGAAACADPQTQVQSRIQLELDACKAAEGDSWEVRFEIGEPFKLDKNLCGSPITNIRITEQINASADVGPWVFDLRQNISDNRWLITRVAWPELEQARSIEALSTPSDSDLEAADKLLAQAEQDVPTHAEVKLLRLKLLLLRRKQTNKKDEADKTSLGVADAYYKQATAAAREQNNPDLELALRLQVIAYYDRFRQLAADSAEPSPQTAEWEAAAVKAIRLEAEEAKKAKNMDLYKKKLEEAAKREQEAAKDAEQRELDARAMGVLSGTLKQRQCEEVNAARTLSPKNTDLKAELDGLASAGGC